MQVGTDYNWTSLVRFGDTGQSTNKHGLTAIAKSIFGPSTVSNLNTSGTSTTWQFDLSTAYGTSGEVPKQQVSADQQKAQAKTINTALEYINAGETDAARQLLDRVLDENKTHAGAVYGLAQADMKDGNYENAEQLFRKAHILNSTAGYDRYADTARILQLDDEAVYAQATAMTRAPSHLDQGVELLVNLTERSGDFSAAHAALGEALLQQGDGMNGLLQYDAAVRTAKPNELGSLMTELHGLRERYPSSAFITQLVGKVELKQGRFDDALQTLKHANDLADNDPAFHRSLAEAYVGVGREKLEHGDISGAMASFDLAREYHPSGVDVKHAQGEALLARAEQRTRLHDYNEALDDYREAVNLIAKGTGNDIREQAAHGAYRISRALEQRIDSGKAELGDQARALQIAHDLEPENKTYSKKLAEVRNAIGDEYTAEGDLEAAAGAYLRAHELDPHDETYEQNAINAWVAWGDERAASFNHDDAVAAYRKAWSLDTDNTAIKQKLADAYYNRGLDHLSWERQEDAARDFREAHHLFSDNADYEYQYNKYSAYLED